MTAHFRELLVAAALVLSAPRVAALLNNENTKPAGRLEGNVLSLRMVADVGTWRPRGDHGVALDVAAFGEEGGQLSVPGPLIRVPQGTSVELTLRNALPAELRVFGLCARPGNCEAIRVAADATRDIHFALNVPGTYHYWASTSGSTLATRLRHDTQLGGAIVVDPPDATPSDRVFVISIHDDPHPPTDDPRQTALSTAEDAVFAINGASWPHTERLRYAVGQSARWRIVNLSNSGHAMHLHGFHFQLESIGDGSTDQALAAAQKRTEVTQFVASGSSFAMSWIPTRLGNWLFHCHMLEHMSARPSEAQVHDGVRHAAGMAGLVLGIEVPGSRAAEVSTASPPRRLSLVLREEPNRYGNHPGFRIEVDGVAAPRLDVGPVPGPVLVLERGQPVHIEVVNRLHRPTSMHWHGIELDSYYDGVPGFSGQGERVAPPIAAGASFVAKFTPPKAGTFIYHTHWHDDAQLAGGLYGPMLVLEPGERYDPSVDHVIVIGLNGVLSAGEREPFALNGRQVPAPIRIRAGVPNRLRFINITANNDALTAILLDRFEPTMWTPVAKDGAKLPPEDTKPRPARQLVSVGETYDFEITPTRPQNLWLEIRRGNGEWVLQAPVVIR